ncbi:adenylate/guanylate cyclase domain-containing protein [Leptothoe sp. ISB3NOV94-8A]|nr:adenylate/guanylate cyclase domain-containing protein [Leptothoe sp. LEGE 181152]
MQSRFSLSIGTKIFGIASSMLGLLLGVAYLNHVRIRQVNYELIDIAYYLAPLTEDIANINVHVLEEEIHFERMVRYYTISNNKIDGIGSAKVNAEEEAFKERGERVKQDIAIAIALADKAAQAAHTPEDILEIARIRPLLEVLASEHQNLHHYSLDIIDRLKASDQEAATLLIDQITDFKDDFDRRIQDILFELTAFIEQSAKHAQATEQRTLNLSFWLTGLASGIGLLFSAWVTAGLVRPVRRLVNNTEKIEQGNLNVEVPVYSSDEIGQLTESFNHMVSKIREKEQLKATFGQYVDPRIVETLLGQPNPTEGSQRQMMTLFFSDMANFSRISELLTPTGLVTLINRYFTLASAPIKEHHGVINQFVGDAVSAFWAPPFVDPADHAKLACYAALEQFDQLTKLRRSLPDLLGIRKGLPEINIRIGLASGEALAGNIGSEQSKSYTVIGPVTQLAEKLETLNKVYGTRILMTAKTRELAGNTIEVREIDRIAFAGEPESIYELLGIAGSTDHKLILLRDCFQTALEVYRNMSGEEAISRFQACLDIVPDDGPSTYYLNLITSSSSSKHVHIK